MKMNSRRIAYSFVYRVSHILVKVKCILLSSIYLCSVCDCLPVPGINPRCFLGVMINKIWFSVVITSEVPAGREGQVAMPPFTSGHAVVGPTITCDGTLPYRQVRYN